ncbi:arylesterase [Sulfurimonas lithotrophica]|uniref:Arylesterase n=1 Tax=Sulfurimonas lithotrophica TaxID=2590022 RepID=A0A5P8P3C4_9BACT|nr:GDSL-type esterase/lipase family protein [Sulfurimonas lithotrophica]QFR50232.1 arylesterase [Sulfurimonas lithotrophica]
MKNYLIVALLILSIIIFFRNMTNNDKEILLSSDATVLAFGDSLTYGFGSDKSYPDFFKEKTLLNTINAGVNGEISAEGVERLKDYLAFEPDLVILCHGGNDILQKLPRNELKSNLKKMIKSIKEVGAKVLLVGVPEFNLLDMDAIDLYHEVAQEEDVLYEEDIIGYIQRRNNLKSDYVHPNEKGYEMMADTFIEILKDNNYIK